MTPPPKTVLPILLSSLVLAGCVTAPLTGPSAGVSPESLSVEPSTAAEEDAGPLIRVAIAVRQNSVQLDAPEAFTLSGFSLETPTVQKGDKKYHEVTLTADQLYSGKASLEPLGEGLIQVNGKTFKGSMEIFVQPHGKLTVVNQLPLEDYVMGVLAGEIPRNWPIEALKAQAIAARTFAVLQRMTARERGEPYDLEGTALAQVYQGSDLVNDNIRQAVLETRGRIITYDAKPISAFFHSNCGGETCGAMDVWSQGKPYLRPVSCPFGNNGAHFRWHTEIPVRDLVRKLRAAGVRIGDVAGFTVLDRDDGNRILRLSLLDADGTRRTVKGSSFRMAVGPDLIRSTRFTAEISGDKVVFNGKGWGHGVGLCQEGACGMALKGYGAFDILRYYYRGIMVEKLDAEKAY